MLFKGEAPVNEEPQVPPGILGPEEGVASKWGKTQVDGQRRGVPGPCEVKYLGLVMLEDKTEFGKGRVNILICPAKREEVILLTTTAPAYNYNHTSIVSPYTIPTYILYTYIVSPYRL